jgi:multimeric flavodoxin WrbA
MDSLKSEEENGNSAVSEYEMARGIPASLIKCRVINRPRLSPCERCVPSCSVY